MSNAAERRATTAELSDTVREYAETLIAAGFTVYVPVNHTGRAVDWFHYSRDRFYGTFSMGIYGGDPQHSMPIPPSRLNGSGALIDAPGVGEMSVEYAELIARETNWSPYAAEPTHEATMRANSGQSVPQRYYRGATVRNAEPWGIGTHYIPAMISPAP